MCPQKNGIPDRWEDYCNYKTVIKECRLLPCKTPLRGQNFTPSDLCRTVREVLKLKIEFVIDFTNTRRYYFYQDFEDGVRYIKIPCVGQCIPPQEVYNQFHMAMDKCTESLSADGVIVVHCTHGLNRSGYLVCNYMMNKFGYTMEQAVHTFNTARGHEIERVAYLDKLRHDKYPAPTENTFELEDHPVAETIVTDSIVNAPAPVEPKSPPLVKRKRHRSHRKRPSTPKEPKLHTPPHKQHSRPPHHRHPHHNSYDYDYNFYPSHHPDHYPRYPDEYREPLYREHYYYEHTPRYSKRPREVEHYHSRREHEQARYYPPPDPRPPRDRHHHPPPVFLPPQAWGPPGHIPNGAVRIHDSRPREQSSSRKHHSEVRTYSGVPYIKH